MLISYLYWCVVFTMCLWFVWINDVCPFYVQIINESESWLLFSSWWTINKYNEIHWNYYYTRTKFGGTKSGMNWNNDLNARALLAACWWSYQVWPLIGLRWPYMKQKNFNAFIQIRNERAYFKEQYAARYAQKKKKPSWIRSILMFLLWWETLKYSWNYLWQQNRSQCHTLNFNQHKHIFKRSYGIYGISMNYNKCQMLFKVLRKSIRNFKLKNDSNVFLILFLNHNE